MSHLPGFGSILSLLVPLIFAAGTQSLTLSGAPATLDENAETQVTITFMCPGCSTDSYLRGVFYPSGTSYFGFTQDNSGNWSNASGSSCSEYYKVPESDMSPEGTWSGTLKMKPDRASPYYNGPGEYLLKVGRYTHSCAAASVWSSETTVAITGPAHTPTPASTQRTDPTSTPNPTSTNTPAPIPTVRISPVTPTSVSLFAKTATMTQDDNLDILGDTSATDSVGLPKEPIDLSDEASVSGQASGPSPFVISFLCIGTGFALLSAGTAWQKTDIWKKIVNREKRE